MGRNWNFCYFLLLRNHNLFGKLGLGASLYLWISFAVIFEPCWLIPTDNIFYLKSLITSLNNEVLIFKCFCQLRKKCPYLEVFSSEFFPHFSAFGLNKGRHGVSLHIQSNAGKCGKWGWSKLRRRDKKRGKVEREINVFFSFKNFDQIKTILTIQFLKYFKIKVPC